MNAMREDALARIGMDVSMKRKGFYWFISLLTVVLCRLEITSYLDWKSDGDSDLVFPPTSPASLLARCDQELSGPPLDRTFSTTAHHYWGGHTIRILQWNVLAQGSHLHDNNNNNNNIILPSSCCGE